MPVYEYTARDQNGTRINGTLEAASAAAARQKLRDALVFPMECTESSSRTGENPLQKPLAIGRPVPSSELSVTTRHLATLLAAGMPLVQALNVLVTQTDNQVLQSIVFQIKKDVVEGSSLSGSMSHFPRVFSPFYVSMVRAGEASGTVPVVLERLADYSEKQQEFVRKIRAALAYPVLMFLFGTLILFFLLTFVIPSITNVFDEMNQSLPVITTALISFSTFLRKAWWLILPAVVGTAVACRFAIVKTEKGRRLWNRVILQAPFFGKMNRKMAVARFSSTLGTLLQHGVPLLTALEISRHITRNILIAEAIENAGREIKEGQALALALSRSGLFPRMATEMIAIGEQSGRLEEMLYRISDSYEKETAAAISFFMSLLEPLMILVMGLLVGFVVISVLLPIFEMNQLVK
ncbi:MAG: Type II secretion system protein F [Syntrophus sp. PtaB.Bin001]|nr:MAG: Type II secretion system protein F [Syntrophus sp. PtaB.Bin001]